MSTNCRRSSALSLRLESEAALRQFVRERAIGIRKAVREITLALPEFDTFPVELEEIALRGLTIENSELDRFPASLRRMTSLERLEVDGSEISAIPAWLGEVELFRLVIRRAVLEHVDVSMNERLQSLVLSELPATSIAFGALDYLRTVEIFATPIAKLEGLSQLMTLRELRVIGGELEEVDSVPSMLAHCSLVGQKLRVPPRALTESDVLRVLNLAKNPMDLVHEFDEALPIEQLDLSECNLEELPAWVLECSELRGLFLRGNHLRALPRDFAERLPRLEMIDLTGNAFDPVPEVLGTLDLHWVRIGDQRR